MIWSRGFGIWTTGRRRRFNENRVFLPGYALPETPV